MKQASILFNTKGVVLLQTLLLFFVFVALASSLITSKTLENVNIHWQQKAFFRIDLEIQALMYYHQNNPKHHEAIYIENHWITYWYQDNKLIINFDGEYFYNLVFELDDQQRLHNRSIQGE